MLDQQLRQELAHVNRDFLTFSGLVGGIQANPDEVLETRGGGLGLKIYDRLESDPHVYAVLQKRKMAVVRYPWELMPASDSAIDIKAADFIREQIQNVGMPQDANTSELGLKGFDGINLCLLDAILKGFSVAEVMWYQDDQGIGIDRILPRDQRRFAFAIADRGWEMKLLTRENPYLGEAIPRRKFVVHSFGDKDGNPYGSGLGSRLFWNVFFKRQNIQFWLIFADKFGSPTPIGKYPLGTDDKGKQTLSMALQALTQGSSVTIPEGMVIELLEAVRSGSVDTYEKLCRYQDEQISECVLGETGSTNQSGDGGSRARDEVGNDVRLEQVQADADLLNETLNRTLVTWLSNLNYPDATPPMLVRRPPDEGLDSRASRDKILFDLGIKLKPDAAIKIYGDAYEMVTGQVQLNGGQLQSMTQMIIAAAAGQVPPESVKKVFEAALGIPADIAMAIVNPIRNFRPEPMQATTPAIPVAPVTAEFAGIKQGVLYDALKFAEPDRDTVKQFADQLRAKATPIVTNWLKEIQKLLDETRDLGEFQAKLVELYPDLPSEDLRQLMADAFGASGLGGYYEAENGY